jgi:TctA family transporter
MIDAGIAALVAITSPIHILHLFFGVVIGLIVGILPGLGGTAGLALLLPFVFGMDPSLALAMMIGLQSVTTTSDTFPSVLMGIPGTPGYCVGRVPARQKGRGSQSTICGVYFLNVWGSFWSSCSLGGNFLRNADNTRCRIW